jgi:Asp-tRNA(Asn)/Glu-tRNA(Gln) amidotransferase A subunit family amidase
MAVRELTIARFHDALRAGQITCLSLTASYLERIGTYNAQLRAVLHVNADALESARQKDIETARLLAAGTTALPALHGVPIIVKDTYGTADMPTTAGCKALETLGMKRDAFVVQKMREAGAIILAKANLHELSMQGITVSSLGGQTLNPYDLTRTPGGSSGGTASALAANLALVGCGGDTMNSLRSPASACSIVGFRPSMGQISRAGVVPVALTQDALGPMARTVGDVRVLFEAMRGEDPDDPVTLSAERNSEAASSSVSRQRSFRIGVLDTYFGTPGDSPDGEDLSDEISTVNETIRSALARGEQHSIAELVHVSLPDDYEVGALLASADVQPFEFRDTMNHFLQDPKYIAYTPHATLESIAQAEGQYLREALSPPFFQTLQSDVFNTTQPAYRSRLARIAALKETLNELYRTFELDVLAFPHQRFFVRKVGSKNNQPGRNGILGALTGRPAICIPGE